MTELDMADLGNSWERLISITDEMLGSLVRTSFSTNVRESYDLSCMLFDANMRSIAQGTYSVPSFTGTAPQTVRMMLEKHPPSTLAPGDVLATNDPWIGTGHLYDINVLRPIFHNGRIVAYALSITHLPDIGGLGFSATGRSIYEEGLRLPVVKLVEHGVPDARLLELIALNVRVPEQTVGDLHANIACTEVAARLVAEFMTEYHLETLDHIADGIVSKSEAAVRAGISDMPDGRYRNEIEVEGVEGPLTLAITLDVIGDRIHADFTGTSPVVPAGINVPINYARAFVVYAVKCVTSPKTPNNFGCVMPITVSAPENCLLHALPPSPTGGRHIIGHLVNPLTMGALAQVAPDHVQADSGMFSLVNVQGRRADGRDVSSIYFSSGGFGALKGIDGAAVVPSPSNMTGTPVEIWEEVTGLTVLRKELLCDSGGAGEFRGGLGQRIEMVNDSGAELTVSFLLSRTEFPAQGLAGGQSGTRRDCLINGEQVHPKRRYRLAHGDTLTLIEAGGGGYGRPEDRDVALIQRDIEEGFVTAEAASRDYGYSLR